MRGALLIVCALLGGCATYHPQPIAPLLIARQFENRTLASDELHAYLARELGHDLAQWPLPHWNRETLTLAAWYYSPALDVARAQWGTAKAGIDVAGAIPNPVLQLPFQWATPNPGPGAPFTTGPALDIPIETAGKRGYRIDQASHLSESARLAIGNEAWKVGAQVRDALLALHADRERSALLLRKVEAEQQIVAMVTKRRAVGESAGPDVDAAVAAQTQAQVDLAASRAAERDAHAQLAAAIGIPAAALEHVAFDFDGFDGASPPPPATEARRDAILHRADLLGSLADYAAAESALQLEVAKQYPDIHLGPGYTYDTGTHKIAFGLAGITLPIFDQNQGGIAQAEAKRKEAAARTVALQDTILGDLDHALTRYRSSIDALQLSDAHRIAARRQLDSQEAGFAAGDVDRLTLTQAKADYQASEIARLDATVAVRQAAGALEDAMQRPLMPDAGRTLSPLQQGAR
ncbi:MULTISPECIES: TolC family protein [Burkholderia cepacia complex]|uniref:TolC family protein n=1 Tax=Burkholderia cepacia complex TaxID=87882 RepID=UPI00073AC414|nr:MULTISPECIES: TolC family protein [Burkholderia cepacia complex]ALV61665.1 divalent cation transporter [Burkholderia cenocepacia]AQQ48104.1 divalent cation transporter [Burkholderia cenocepacia]ONJ04180.1 divalent cation transporter [Burkholderia cenocepacia]ONJ09550.1 divalent cation transporter [Burkholderia cenocepacia]ONJ29291.1 divalent cation transporter [Burkholderia cenocepacia]